MNCLLIIPGMSFTGATITQGKSLGGSETAGYYVAKGLAKLGWNVTVASNMQPQDADKWDGVRYVPLEPFLEKGKDKLKFDVLIGQRIPNICSIWKEAKVKFFWTHDLALRRHAKLFANQIWALDGVFVVSDFHRKQLSKTYGYPEDWIHVLQNGVDLDLFSPSVSPEIKQVGKRLIYTSRPERGLESLVGPNGLMRLLLKLDPSISLLVCGYDNTTPELAELYQHLWNQCRELPNVELVDSQGKEDLAKLFKGAWLHVYPTTFEEVSCISVMEAQCAGTPVVASPAGALPETLKDAGVVFVGEPKKKPNVGEFAKTILNLRDNPETWLNLHKAALANTPQYSWEHGIQTVEKTVGKRFETLTADKVKLTKHLVYMSDVSLARCGAKGGLGKFLTQKDFGWAFGNDKDFLEHYKRQSQNNRKQGWDHGFGEPWIEGLPRAHAFFAAARGFKKGTRVLDFGCSIGHFTEAFARHAPQCEFTGWDIVKQDIEEGTELIKEAGTPNVMLQEVPNFANLPVFDVLFFMEVFEHLKNPAETLEQLESLVCPGGFIMLSSPSGPWEAKGNDKNHLWHFESADLEEMFQNKPEFSIVYAPAPETGKRGELLGHYLIAYKVDHKPLGKVDIERKLSQQQPQQTLSVCMICRNNSDTLAKTLNSVKDIASEIIIGVDVGKFPKSSGQRKGRTWRIAQEFGAKTLPIISPLATGFDHARNKTIELAKSDWILWIDDDEVLEWPSRLHKYLRDNVIDAYCFPQHHYSAEPAGLIKTDFPARLFRNNIGVKFYGKVHEHPARDESGAGFKMPYVIPEVAIMHFGYETEEIRKVRFSRNLNLMRLDRKLFPERTLGKFLWLRDLAHINTYLVQSGRFDIREIHSNAKEGLELWRELIEKNETRLVIDALPYVTTLVQSLVKQGIKFSYTLKVELLGMGINLNGNQLQGEMLNPKDLKKLLGMLTKQQVDVVSGEYL